MSENKIVKYLVTANDGTYIIDVDSSWKITYGPIAIGGKNYGNGSMALRIYENDTKQRAIFTGVTSFRDLSIPIMKKITHTIGEDKYEHDDKGNKHIVEKAVKKETWEEVKYL